MGGGLLPPRPGPPSTKLKKRKPELAIPLLNHQFSDESPESVQARLNLLLQREGMETLESALQETAVLAVEDKKKVSEQVKTTIGIAVSNLNVNDDSLVNSSLEESNKNNLQRE